MGQDNFDGVLCADEPAGGNENAPRRAVTFSGEQKRFFAAVRDGLFALIALLLFALSFAPVYSAGEELRLSNTDIVAMMFDTAYDENDVGALRDISDKMADVEKKLSDALSEGRYAAADRLAVDYNILVSRAYIRTGMYDGAEGLYIVRGLIGLGMIVFSFGIAVVYAFAFVRVLCGRERFPAAFGGRTADRAKAPGILIAAYFMYLLLMLLTCVSGYPQGLRIEGAYAAALAFAALGTVVCVSGAAATALVESAVQGAERKSMRRRVLGGAVAFCTAVVTVGVMFAPDALTLRTDEAKGSADAMSLNSLVLTDESREIYEETLIGLAFAEKQEYMMQRLRGAQGYILQDDCESTLFVFAIAYDDGNRARFLAAGYYMLLLAAALVGAAGVCAVAGINDDGARKAWRGLIAAGAFATVLFIAACSVVAGIVNYNFDWLDLGALAESEGLSGITAGVGACGIASFLLAAAGAVAARLAAGCGLGKSGGRPQDGDVGNRPEESGSKAAEPTYAEEEEDGFLA